MSDIAATAEGLIGQHTGKYDCSAFTQYVYSLHGKTIPRTNDLSYNVLRGIALIVK